MGEREEAGWKEKEEGGSGTGAEEEKGGWLKDWGANAEDASASSSELSELPDELSLETEKLDSELSLLWRGWIAPGVSRRAF